tara:strand:- start:187 stop:330 length:144 start_codon:yes stop_codon:yes gene_type:complete
MSYQRNPRKLQKVNENADGNVQDSQGDEDKTLPVQQDGDGSSKKDGD